MGLGLIWRREFFEFNFEDGFESEVFVEVFIIFEEFRGFEIFVTVEVDEKDF